MTTFAYMAAFAAGCFILAWAYVAFDPQLLVQLELEGGK